MSKANETRNVFHVRRQKYSSPNDDLFDAKNRSFRAHNSCLHDDLVKTATEFTGITEGTALIREAFQALIHLEASRRLAALGGIMPDLEDIPLRRFE
jgi:hypothetical protein